METIGRYRILGELGRGAMGIVYRAQDPAIGREVAIKTIRLTELADAGERNKLRERLFREAQSAGILSHPGIVTIYDVGEEDDVAYVAMECVAGPTLDRMSVSDPPDSALVLSILAQTGAALDYAHKRGIIHRDIKPANIIIHDRTTVKITDFGVARIQSHQLTQAGSIVGTPNYMSPEQIQGQPVDGRSDQFSLAVICYELLTGEKPFAADSIAALAYRIVREDAAPVHRLNATLDWPVDTVVQRGLAKRPEDRYPTCADFAFALENACRTSRKWKPVPPGSSQQMATVTGQAAPLVGMLDRSTPPPVSTLSEPEPEPFPEERQPDPAPLRMLRTLTLVLIGGGLLAALVVTALRYAETRREQAASITADQRSKSPEVAQAPTSESRGQLPGEAPQPAERVPEAKAPEPRAKGTREARLATNPPGASLVIDGSSELTCQSPCSLTLPDGRHTLAATMQGYRRTLRILELPADSEVFLNLERSSGTVMIRSEPKGASITVNGEERPEKTPVMLTLPVGKYTLQVEYGSQRERQEVEVRDSALTNVAITFDHP